MRESVRYVQVRRISIGMLFPEASILLLIRRQISYVCMSYLDFLSDRSSTQHNE